MALPPLPKLIDVRGVKDAETLAKRLSGWGTGVQDVLRALRSDSEGLDRRLASLLSAGSAPAVHAASHLPGGYDALTTGVPERIRPDDSAAEGVAASFSRSDHLHEILCDAPIRIRPDDASDEGAATTFARSDHMHQIVAGTPGRIRPDDAADEGVDTTFARGDHQHECLAGTPGAIQPDDAAAEGSATTFARSDHTHAIVAAVPGTIQPDDSAAEGSATSFARSDHKHAIVAATAGAATPGDAAAEGSSTSFARADHTHSLPAFGTGAGTFCQGNDSRIRAIEQVWNADIPPASPSASDDECSTGSLSGVWTQFNVPTLLTLTASSSRKKLKFESAGSAALAYVGVYQAVPAGGEYVIYAKLQPMLVSSAAGCGFGIMVSETISATADIRLMEFSGATTATNLRTTTLTAYNGTASATTSFTGAFVPYYRMRINGTTCASDYSTDGVQWKQLASVTLGFTPVHMGVVMTKTAVADVFHGWMDFFRVQSGAGTSGFDATFIGGFL